MLQTYKAVIRVLDLDEQKLMEMAGLPVTFLQTTQSVTGKQRLALDLAIERLSARPDLAYHLAMFRARTPRAASSLAFASCATVERGLERLSLLKRSAEGISFFTKRLQDRLRIEIKPRAPDITILHWEALCELLFIVELCRTHSARMIKPSAVGIMDAAKLRFEDIAYLGVAPTNSSVVFLELPLSDANLPLLTASNSPSAMDVAWIEANASPSPAPSSSEQVKQALKERLPAGQSSIQDIARHLNINVRKLQRQLKTEGRSFRGLLEETRRELSAHYLKEEQRPVSEVSYLLGYQDQNSFYRAFKGWTGTTTTSWSD
ncbi:AraC family transcriptional regulator [Roseibium algae]|uniref:Helix-turn-helix domain-containing protein n=1 Tax=Roseibium algae TaxID=3123038 RepID=A0ABU8TQK9_9HYPH